MSYPQNPTRLGVCRFCCKTIAGIIAGLMANISLSAGEPNEGLFAQVERSTVNAPSESLREKRKLDTSGNLVI